MLNLINKKNSHFAQKPLNHGFAITSSYVSLINPFFFNHYSYELYKKLCYNSPNEKIYVKQSYMILTWFHYLDFVVKNKNFITKKKITLLSLPTKIKKFTITKAPIAHKTNSKEQIQVTFFYYKIIYKNIINADLNSYSFFKNNNELLLFFLLSKNTVSGSETNLLFLKTTRVSITFIDLNFFIYVRN